MVLLTERKLEWHFSRGTIVTMTLLSDGSAVMERKEIDILTGRYSPSSQQFVANADDIVQILRECVEDVTECLSVSSQQSTFVSTENSVGVCNLG